MKVAAPEFSLVPSGTGSSASMENFVSSSEYPLPQTPSEHSFRFPSVRTRQIANGGKTKKPAAASAMYAIIITAIVPASSQSTFWSSLPISVKVPFPTS